MSVFFLLILIATSTNLLKLFGNYSFSVKALQILSNSVLFIGSYLAIYYNYQIAYGIILLTFIVYTILFHHLKNKKANEKIDLNTSPLIDDLNPNLLEIEDYDFRYYMNDKINAHVSYTKKKNTIIISSKALEVLNSDELSSIIYHEIGHLKYKHRYVNSVLEILFKLLFIFFSYFAVKYCFYNNINVLAGVVFCVNLLRIYPFAFNMIRMPVYRQQEYIADAYSVKYTGVHLFDTLNKIYEYDEKGINAASFGKIAFFFFSKHPLRMDRLKKIQNNICYET